ncbi:MAG: hypothetical protein MUQ00_11890 [Candidatus Aminicenantes bacterium]|nr:hypothetical protein [Candidatus Aminicenantes bacterium]
MNGNDYLSLFRRIARTQAGKEQRLEEIEKRLIHLRNGAALTYDDLKIIEDQDYWPFSKYWMWPHRSQIEDKLKNTAGLIKKLAGAALGTSEAHREKERWAVSELFHIFKNIALVSIVLRFALPEHYAIYSPPTLEILRIERGTNEVDEYMKYISEMRILRGSFGVKKTSEVDMIVWAIFHSSESNRKELKRKLSKRLPGNLTPEELILFLSDNPLKIAQEYLQRRDFMTAGFWAAKAFEKYLNEECRRNGMIIREQAHQRSEMIHWLRSQTPLWRRAYNGQVLYDTKEIRNKIVPGVKPFVVQDVKDFISHLERLKQISIQRDR